MTHHLPPEELAELAAHCISLQCELATERAHADRWQKLAGHYDDIRDWLRLCQDNPEGHAEFYKECCLLIFGHYRDESDEEDETL